MTAVRNVVCHRVASPRFLGVIAPHRAIESLLIISIGASAAYRRPSSCASSMSQAAKPVIGGSGGSRQPSRESMMKRWRLEEVDVELPAAVKRLRNRRSSVGETHKIAAAEVGRSGNKERPEANAVA